MQSKREILQKALENINHPLSEITRRTTYRGHSPGVKPMTGIKLNLPKTSTMAAKMERVLADKSPEGKKRMKQMNNLVIGREEDGDKISLEFKTSASRERFRKMMNESVELDEMKKSDGPFTVVALKGNKVVGQLRNVEHNDIEVAIDMMQKENQGAKISVESKSGKVVHTEEVEQVDETVRTMFKGFGREATEFQTKLKKSGFDKDYRKMMQNFIKRAKPGDGFYVTMSDKMIDFQVHPVADMMMGAKIKKLGDKDDLGEFGTRQLIAIKEDVQLDEGSTIEFKFDNPMKAGAFASRIMRDKLASEVDRYVSGRKEMVQVIMHPNDYERNDIEKLAKQYKGQLREDINESILDKVDRMMDKVERKWTGLQEGMLIIVTVYQGTKRK